MKKDFAANLRYASDPLGTLHKYQRMRRFYSFYPEIFIKQAYYWLYQRIRPNTTLIDMGAGLGESAIYFAMHPNVKHVLAFEPLPLYFREAREYVAAGPFKSKIALYNKAVLGQQGSKTLSLGRAGMFDYESMKEEQEGVKVGAVSLSSILKGLKSVAIKCDVEGVEKTMFAGAGLRQVYAMQIEYHNSKKEVVRALEKEYSLKTEPNTESAGFGMIYAERKLR